MPELSQDATIDSDAKAHQEIEGDLQGEISSDNSHVWIETPAT